MNISNTRVQITHKPIAFLTFWQDIAVYVGDIDLPFPDNPKKLDDITIQLDSYFNPLKQCLIDVYRLNNCQNLQSLIKPIIVLDVLGNQCFNLKRDVVDVKDIDLLEDLGVYIVQKYIHTTSNVDTEISFPRSAKIIRLDWYKAQKANHRR